VPPMSATKAGAVGEGWVIDRHLQAERFGF
jgi:hypothetical protein